MSAEQTNWRALVPIWPGVLTYSTANPSHGESADAVCAHVPRLIGSKPARAIGAPTISFFWADQFPGRITGAERIIDAIKAATPSFAER